MSIIYYIILYKYSFDVTTVQGADAWCVEGRRCSAAFLSI